MATEIDSTEQKRRSTRSKTDKNGKIINDGNELSKRVRNNNREKNDGAQEQRLWYGKFSVYANCEQRARAI